MVVRAFFRVELHGKVEGGIAAVEAAQTGRGRGRGRGEQAWGHGLHDSVVDCPRMFCCSKKSSFC